MKIKLFLLVYIMFNMSSAFNNYSTKYIKLTADRHIATSALDPARPPIYI